MKPAVERAVDETLGERQELVSELFHALSQPITALRCSLELALHDPTAAPPSQENLETALAHAEKIAQLATGIRELIQADDPGDERIALSLENYLREVLLDMELVAEAAQVEIQLRGNITGRVMAEPHRLRQALFYLVEFALASAAAGSVVNLEVSEQAGQAVATLTADPRYPAASSLAFPGPEAETKSQMLSRRLGLAIAGRIFETAGGRLQMQEDGHHLRLRFCLPLTT